MVRKVDSPYNVGEEGGLERSEARVDVVELSSWFPNSVAINRKFCPYRSKLGLECGAVRERLGRRQNLMPLYNDLTLA